MSNDALEAVLTHPLPPLPAQPAGVPWPTTAWPDGSVPTTVDVQMVDWVRAIGLPHTVIATKSDKVKSSQRAKRRKELANGLDLDTGDVEWVSASKNDNIARLRDLFRLWLQG